MGIYAVHLAGSGRMQVRLRLSFSCCVMYSRTSTRHGSLCLLCISCISCIHILSHTCSCYYMRSICLYLSILVPPSLLSTLCGSPYSWPSCAPLKCCRLVSPRHVREISPPPCLAQTSSSLSHLASTRRQRPDQPTSLSSSASVSAPDQNAGQWTGDERPAVIARPVATLKSDSHPDVHLPALPACLQHPHPHLSVGRPRSSQFRWHEGLSPTPRLISPPGPDLVWFVYFGLYSVKTPQIHLLKDPTLRPGPLSSSPTFLYSQKPHDASDCTAKLTVNDETYKDFWRRNEPVVLGSATNPVEYLRPPENKSVLRPTEAATASLSTV